MRRDVDPIVSAWQFGSHADRERLAEAFRPAVVAGAVNAGAADEVQVAVLLQVMAAAIQAEQEAAEPTPLPNRAGRRGRHRTPL